MSQFKETVIRLDGAPFAKIVQAEAREYLSTLQTNSADCFCTDAPYALRHLPKEELAAMLVDWATKGFHEGKKRKGFMGKAWDAMVPQPNVFAECLRVAKPGAYLTCFAGAKTQHLMGTSIALGGFEIRDLLAWLYGSGFPKGKNVSNELDKQFGGCEARGRAVPTASTHLPGGKYADEKLTGNPVEKYAPRTELGQKWDGFDIALKPALEPATLAQKPRDGTYAENLVKWGTGALNVGACRIPDETSVERDRWPAGVILDGSEEVRGMFPASKGGAFDGKVSPDGNKRRAVYGKFGGTQGKGHKGTEGSASRIFFCSKASRKERDAGLAELALKRRTDGRETESEHPRLRTSDVLNYHPTVKPIDVMRWLLRLTCPPGGTVIDPFFGSGTTGCAALLEGFNYIGIDMDEAEGYHKIATLRNLYFAEIGRDIFQEWSDSG